MQQIKYVGLKSLQEYDAALKDFIDKQISNAVSQTVITADSYLKFPALGSEDSLYVDTTINKVYRWDDGTLKYYCISGPDYNDIDIIDGCN